MNIEEDSMNKVICNNIKHIGHVHFADSNRKPMGCGHTQMKDVANALIRSGYNGYVSAEAFPWPDQEQAAAQTIRSFRKYFR
jgi:sugar phosphate isomerase/epimerase